MTNSPLNPSIQPYHQTLKLKCKERKRKRTYLALLVDLIRVSQKIGICRFFCTLRNFIESQYEMLFQWYPQSKEILLNLSMKC